MALEASLALNVSVASQHIYIRTCPSHLQRREQARAQGLANWHTAPASGVDSFIPRPVVQATALGTKAISDCVRNQQHMEPSDRPFSLIA